MHVLLLNINYNRLHVMDVAQFIFHRLLHGHDLIQRTASSTVKWITECLTLRIQVTVIQMRACLPRENVLNLNVILPLLLGAPFRTLP